MIYFIIFTVLVIVLCSVMMQLFFPIIIKFTFWDFTDYMLSSYQLLIIFLIPWARPKNTEKDLHPKALSHM